MCANWLCADRFGLGWAHDAFSFACHMFMRFPCIRTSFQYSSYLKLLGTFLIVILSLPPTRNPLHFVHLRLLIQPLFLFGFVMMMPTRHSRRTFLDEVFIWNAKTYWWTLPTLTFPLSFTVGNGSHCVTSRSLVLSCSFRSFTPTCTGLIIQYFSSLLAFEVHAFLSHRSLLRMCFEFLG